MTYSPEEGFSSGVIPKKTGKNKKGDCKINKGVL